MTTVGHLDDFKALEPFFRIIEQGLDGLADAGTSSTLSRSSTLVAGLRSSVVSR